MHSNNNLQSHKTRNNNLDVGGTDRPIGRGVPGTYNPPGAEKNTVFYGMGENDWSSKKRYTRYQRSEENSLSPLR